MGREWAVISALGPTPVPVPKALGFCDDKSVTGAHFYLMGFVDGAPFYNSDQVRDAVPEPQREKLAHSFIDVLADLHAVDPDAVGLSDLGKRDSYVGRQLRTWYQSWNASIEPAKFDDSRAHALQKFFSDNLPEQEPGARRARRLRISQHIDRSGWRASPPWSTGRYRRSAIRSRISPMRSTRGPILRIRSPPTAASPTRPAGFPSRSDLAARYAARTGRDLSKLDYYLGFNRWKTAAIIHGVYARYMAGQKSADGVDLDDLRRRISLSLEQAEQAAARLK